MAGLDMKKFLLNTIKQMIWGGEPSYKTMQYAIGWVDKGELLQSDLEQIQVWYNEYEDSLKPTKPETTLQEEIALKLQEISSICEMTIYQGFDVELSTGKEHFSLTEKDQLNLFGKQLQISLGTPEIEYHQDGELCKFYSLKDMNVVVTTAMIFKSFQTTYCNSLNMWIKNCETKELLKNISYGATIPEKYQSEVLKKYMKDYKELLKL